MALLQIKPNQTQEDLTGKEKSTSMKKIKATEPKDGFFILKECLSYIISFKLKNDFALRAKRCL